MFELAQCKSSLKNAERLKEVTEPLLADKYSNGILCPKCNQLVFLYILSRSGTSYFHNSL